MNDLHFEISLDHMMDDEYIDRAKEHAMREIGYKLGEMLVDENYHLLKLIVENPPPYWREVYGNNPFADRHHFKYKYRLEVWKVRERIIEIPIYPEMDMIIPKTVESLAHTPTSMIKNEVIKRLRMWSLFDAIDKRHNESIEAFDLWIDG